MDEVKYPEQSELEHFNNCSGCGRCNNLMQFFGQCYCCDVVVAKEHLYYDHPGGDYYCSDCVGAMPDDNTNDFVLCGECLKRDYRENMIIYHENFDTTWTCENCVTQSIINDRFEILDL